MSQMPDFDLLNQADYYYLRDISEPRDNSLRLVIEQAVLNRGGKPADIPDELPEVRAIKTDAFPIESITGCKSFELVWDFYAAYLVAEELAGTGGSWNGEIYEGKLFRIYAKSNFLDHLARDIGETLEPIQHYKLICLNHLIDVAATNPPKVSQLNLVR
ncbi:MAG: hypothetical protein JSS69_12950 [Acidobacteria bacterium]|nr:hypothetical protein [Acidobacteriota bacterium]